jgi:tetratricopeptide (TPR) repeat protein
LGSDPFDAALAQQVAFRLVEFGRLREAMELLDRFQAFPQGKDPLWWTQFEILQNHGRYDEKLAYHIDLLKKDPVVHDDLYRLGHLWWTVSDVAKLGMFDEAEALYQIVASVPTPASPPRDPEFVRWGRQRFLEDFYLEATGRVEEAAARTIERVAELSNDEILNAWYVEAAWIAKMFRAIGETDRAIELLEAMRHYQFRTSRWAERQLTHSMRLARMYMQVGRGDDARPVLEEIATSLQSETDGGARHPETLLRLASAYGWLGDDEAALRALDLAIDYGAFDMTLCCADLNPHAEPGQGEVAWWAGLEGDPRFIQSRARMRAQVEEQRSNIRALLAQNDMEQLLAPLVAADWAGRSN